MSSFWVKFSPTKFVLIIEIFLEEQSWVEGVDRSGSHVGPRLTQGNI